MRLFFKKKKLTKFKVKIYLQISSCRRREREYAIARKKLIDLFLKEFNHP